MNTTKPSGINKLQQKNSSFWLKMSIICGLLPITLDTFKDQVDPILEALAPYVFFVMVVLTLSIIVPVVGIFKVRGWWKLVPILLVLFNLVLSFLAYALYQWANSCAGSAYQC